MPRPLCVITHRVFPETLALLEPHCRILGNDSDETLPRETVIERARDAAAIMVFIPDRVDRAFLEHCPKLRIVAAALKGYDNIDLAAAAERGVTVTMVPDALTAPTAELAIGLAIALARHVLAGDDRVRSGAFQGWRPTLYGTGLAGATVGLLGFGRIGRAIARRLGGFDTTILYHDSRRASPADEAALAAAFAPLDTLLRSSDFLFLCVPLMDATVNLIDERTLALMKPGALLINPARGSVVDEEAVARALGTGHLAGYAADVFAFEDWARPDRPRARSDALASLPDRRLFTPHLGSATVAARRRIEREAAQSIVDALGGERPRNVISPG